jgi:predicted RNA methylase
MLQDTVRTEAYQNAILNNRSLFEGKVVVDIGCGTGILSLFAAKAGAKKVIAIDASDMYKEATEIVAMNGYQDIITVVHGKVENLIDENRELLQLQKGEKVDVVISEWMGYALFFETMLPSVMAARDNLMDRENGTMWPNRSVMFLEGARDCRLDYWSNVYGFNMNVMKDRVIKELKGEASVEIVEDENIVTNRNEIIVHDLNTCSDDELDFEVPFELNRRSTVDAEEQRIDKLVISFDIYFDWRECSMTSFSTGCQTRPTHWKQTTLWFNPNDVVPTLKKHEVMKGMFSMSRNKTNHRDIDFLVQWEIGSRSNSVAFQKRLNGTIISKLTSN